MKSSVLPAYCLVALLTSCLSTPTNPADEQAFAPVRVVLETNCVHCHGENRLSTMPPINDAQALSKLVGTNWIVAGKPELSRFFQVVTFPDTIPGAMPPTGHAISKQEVETLRTWIHAAKCLVRSDDRSKWLQDERMRVASAPAPSHASDQLPARSSHHAAS